MFIRLLSVNPRCSFCELVSSAYIRVWYLLLAYFLLLPLLLVSFSSSWSATLRVQTTPLSSIPFSRSRRFTKRHRRPLSLYTKTPSPFRISSSFIYHTHRLSRLDIHLRVYSGLCDFLKTRAFSSPLFPPPLASFHLCKPSLVTLDLRGFTAPLIRLLGNTPDCISCTFTIQCLQ